MESKDLKNIVIVFENVEILTLEPKDFVYIKLEDITEDIVLNISGQLIKFKYAKKIKLRLYNNLKLDRLSEYRDITSIDFIYKDKSEERIFVDWNDKDDYDNFNQINKITDKYIEINIENR